MLSILDVWSTMKFRLHSISGDLHTMNFAVVEDAALNVCKNIMNIYIYYIWQKNYDLFCFYGSFYMESHSQMFFSSFAV